MNNHLPSRQQLRKLIRTRRNALDNDFQNKAGEKLVEQLNNHPKFKQAKTIALYLANDGELDLTATIESCWQQDMRVYLPILHPFSGNHLLFTQYRKSQTMIANKFGILEPKLNQSELIPAKDIDLICTPLVAFDKTGARLGMGGGFYDRTLAPIVNGTKAQDRVHINRKRPYIVGLAHDCQQVEQVPTEFWDIPIPEIITPSQRIIC